MKSKLIFLSFGLIVIPLALTVINNEVYAQIQKQKKVFTYQNPISNGIDKGMRDCHVFEDGGKYYLVGTSYPFWYWQKEKKSRD